MRSDLKNALSGHDMAYLPEIARQSFRDQLSRLPDSEPIFLAFYLPAFQNGLREILYYTAVSSLYPRPVYITGSNTVINGNEHIGQKNVFPEESWFLQQGISHVVVVYGVDRTRLLIKILSPGDLKG